MARLVEALKMGLTRFNMMSNAEGAVEKRQYLLIYSEFLSLALLTT